MAVDFSGFSSGPGTRVGGPKKKKRSGPRKSPKWKTLTGGKYASVAAVQEELIKEGHLAPLNARGGSNADGIWGSVTEAAWHKRLEALKPPKPPAKSIWQDIRETITEARVRKLYTDPTTITWTAKVLKVVTTKIPVPGVGPAGALNAVKGGGEPQNCPYYVHARILGVDGNEPSPHWFMPAPCPTPADDNSNAALVELFPKYFPRTWVGTDSPVKPSVGDFIKVKENFGKGHSDDGEYVGFAGENKIPTLFDATKSQIAMLQAGRRKKEVPYSNPRRNKDATCDEAKEKYFAIPKDLRKKNDDLPRYKKIKDVRNARLDWRISCNPQCSDEDPGMPPLTFEGTASGTYGIARGFKRHNNVGMDLAMPVGHVLYAPFNGTVLKVYCNKGRAMRTNSCDEVERGWT